MQDLPVEVVLNIFQFCSFEDYLRLRKVCQRFKHIIDSAGEIWRAFDADFQLPIEHFRSVVISHATHLRRLILRGSQKRIRYSSPALYIETSLSMCSNLTYLDLSYNTSITVLDFVKNMTCLKTLILFSCTSIDCINMIECLKSCHGLKFLSISDCTQLDHVRSTSLIKIVEDLPLLEFFNAEFTCRFSIADTRTLLQQNKLKELWVTPVWEDPNLWLDLKREYEQIKFGFCINEHCKMIFLPNYIYEDEDYY